MGPNLSWWPPEAETPHTSQGPHWKNKKRRGAQHGPHGSLPQGRRAPAAPWHCSGAAHSLGELGLGHHVCPCPTCALGQGKEGRISCSVLSQGLLLQPVTSQVLSCLMMIPVKPEAVYLILGFCSLAHTLASEKVYQQFHLHISPALLNPIVMSIAPKMWSLFQKDQYNLLPGSCAFSSYLVRK